MALKMTLLHSVEQHLAVLTPQPFNLVGSGMALAAIMNSAPQVGVSAYVVPLSETPSDNTRATGPALQRIDVSFGVVLAVRVVNNKHGSKSSEQLENARDAVRKKLFGWIPNTALVPCLLGVSELINMENSTIWWMDRYTTAIQRRAPQF